MLTDQELKTRITDLEAVDSLIGSFNKTFASNMQTARNSGAVPDDVTSIRLGRTVLVITADQFSVNDKRLLKNLRNFI